MSDTKRKMAQALKELMAEKPLKRITIQDIVERSHMTRQSFYRKMLQDMDWERMSGYLKPAVEAQIRRLVSGMLTEQETRSLSGGRELLIDFLTVSVIQYIFRYISSRKVQKEQNAASLRELLQICSLLCAKCRSSSENKDEVYIKNRIKTA